MNIEQLVIHSINDDNEAFTHLMKMFQNDLYRVAQARLKNIDDINDAIQETMIIAYKSMKKLENIQYFKKWIIKILINECNKIYKNNKRIFKIFEKSKEYYNTINSDDLNIINVENKIELKEIFEKLNYNERICIVLFYNSNYSILEISDILSVSPNTVKSRITRAKQKIKKIYRGGEKYETSK